MGFDLLPRELDKLQTLFVAGSLAQKRLARGVRLNQVEATALIACVLHELIRDGNHSVAELMAIGASRSPIPLGTEPRADHSSRRGDRAIRYRCLAD